MAAILFRGRWVNLHGMKWPFNADITYADGLATQEPKASITMALPHSARSISGFKLRYWGPDKIAAVFQMTFSNAFSWMKMHEFRFRFHWSLFPIYNDWVNNREAGDLRRYRAHYDVTVMPTHTPKVTTHSAVVTSSSLRQYRSY